MTNYIDYRKHNFDSSDSDIFAHLDANPVKLYGKGKLSFVGRHEGESNRSRGKKRYRG